MPSLSPFKFCVVLCATAAIAACTPALRSEENPDGGELASEPESQTPNACDDGGPCVSEFDERVAECDRLIALTCGAGAADGPSCAASSACYAAQLIATYEPSSCVAALDDERRFPECGFSACETLVTQVCGGLDADAPCETSSGCSPARTLLERSEQGDDSALATEASESCRAALEDELVFAPCLLSGE